MQALGGHCESPLPSNGKCKFPSTRDGERCVAPGQPPPSASGSKPTSPNCGRPPGCGFDVVPSDEARPDLTFGGDSQRFKSSRAPATARSRAALRPPSSGRRPGPWPGASGAFPYSPSRHRSSTAATLPRWRELLAVFESARPREVRLFHEQPKPPRSRLRHFATTGARLRRAPPASRPDNRCILPRCRRRRSRDRERSAARRSANAPQGPDWRCRVGRKQ